MCSVLEAITFVEILHLLQDLREPHVKKINKIKSFSTTGGIKKEDAHFLSCSKSPVIFMFEWPYFMSDSEKCFYGKQHDLLVVFSDNPKVCIEISEAAFSKDATYLLRYQSRSGKHFGAELTPGEGRRS